MSIQNRGSSVPLNGQRSSLFIPKATEDEIRAMICRLPNRQYFILDRDLAALCEMTTGQINECAERNKNHFVGKHYFPEDLRFEITRKECTQLLSDYPRLSPTNGSKKISFDTGASFIFKDVPWCYTVYGAKVLAEVINTPLARERMKMVTHVFIKHEFIDKCPAGEGDDESSSDHDYKESPLTPKELEGKIRSMICRLPNRPPFILDCDLADIYGVDIKRINRQVKRNKVLFSDECRFQLGRKECSQLLEHYPRFLLTDEWNSTTDSHTPFKKLPWAYTLYGIKTLGAVLNTPVVKESIEYIVRAFEFCELSEEEYVKDQDDDERENHEKEDLFPSPKEYTFSLLSPEAMEDTIRSMVYHLPNHPPFLLDRELADIYEVKTERINRQAKRNNDIFTDDFRFQLTREECDELIENYPHLSSSSQNKKSNLSNWQTLKNQTVTGEKMNKTNSSFIFKNLPWCYTACGANALSMVLHTPVARERAKLILRAFTKIEAVVDNHMERLSKGQQDEMRKLLGFFEDNGDGKIYTEEDFSPFSFEGLHLDEALYINGMPYFTCRAIGTLLEYENPGNAIKEIVAKNPDIIPSSIRINLSLSKGLFRFYGKADLYNPLGLLLIIMKSTQPVAFKYEDIASYLVKMYITPLFSSKSKEKQIHAIPKELVEKIDRLIALTDQKKAPEPVQKPSPFPEIPEEFVERAERLVALAREASQDSNINAILYNMGFTAYPSHETFSMSAEAVATSSISRSAMDEIPISVKSSAPVLAKTTPHPVKKAQKEDPAPKKNYMASILDSHEAGRKLGVSGQKVIYWDTQGRFDGYKQCTPPFKITVRMLKKWARTERLDDLTELKSEITITEAAKFFAASRTFIREAIYNNILDAKKNDSGQYLINTESLINLM